MVAADHLQVPRQHGLFHHHGIDLGDGTIAHYLEGRAIIRSSLDEFCAGQNYSVINHEFACTKSVTLRRAMSRIGEQSYNLLFNNCEHFANWCKTGKHRSNQMEDWLESSSLGAMAIGQFLPAAVLTAVNLLLKKSLSDEKSREASKQALKNLQNLRKSLLLKLEETLEEIEHWFQTDLASHKSWGQETKSRTLLLRGQRLADELTRLENLETRITILLDEVDPEN